jgi:hypothetical protein
MEAPVFFALPAQFLLFIIDHACFARYNLLTLWLSQGYGTMNDKVYGELDSLYDGFLRLTTDGQEAVVETAESLLEAQREIESLMENTGAKTLLPTGAGEKSNRRILGRGRSRAGG